MPKFVWRVYVVCSVVFLNNPVLKIMLRGNQLLAESFRVFC